jgi:DNA-binding transcriptional MerR regulator
MSIAPGYTNDQVREFVYEYDRQPHGTKGTWLARTEVSPRMLHRWRSAVYDGDIDKGLVPGDTGGVKSSYSQRRAVASRQDAEARRIAELEKQVAELQSSNSKLEATNDALGKAIGLLHELNAHGPDDDPDQSKPSDS